MVNDGAAEGLLPHTHRQSASLARMLSPKTL